MKKEGEALRRACPSLPGPLTPPPKHLHKRSVFLSPLQREKKGGGVSLPASPKVTGERERGRGDPFGDMPKGCFRTESFGRRREATLRLKTLRLGSLALQKKPSKPPSEAKNIMGDGT